MATNCYCRGNAICPSCDKHRCTGQCHCDDTQQTAAGHVNPSPTRLQAWTQHQEARR